MTVKASCNLSGPSSFLKDPLFSFSKLSNDFPTQVCHQADPGPTQHSAPTDEHPPKNQQSDSYFFFKKMDPTFFISSSTETAVAMGTECQGRHYKHRQKNAGVTEVVRSCATALLFWSCSEKIFFVAPLNDDQSSASDAPLPALQVPCVFLTVPSIRIKWLSGRSNASLHKVIFVSKGSRTDADVSST